MLFGPIEESYALLLKIICSLIRRKTLRSRNESYFHCIDIS